jgi:hypothetical protein
MAARKLFVKPRELGPPPPLIPTSLNQLPSKQFQSTSTSGSASCRQPKRSHNENHIGRAKGLSSPRKWPLKRHRPEGSKVGRKTGNVMDDTLHRPLTSRGRSPRAIQQLQKHSPADRGENWRPGTRGRRTQVRQRSLSPSAPHISLR